MNNEKERTISENKLFNENVQKINLKFPVFINV
jgi:hypothetical protein